MTGTILTSQRLRLVPFAERHLTQRYVDWLNDRQLMRYSEQRHRHHSMESCLAYYQSFDKTPHQFWAIECPSCDPCHVGNMSVHRDLNNGLADVSILLGEKSLHGQGYGLEAWSLMCDHLLNTVGVRKITAGTMACNLSMLRIMERSGMVEDGERMAHYLVDGKPTSILYRALFAPS